MYEYKSVIRRWVDGDTCILDVDLGFDCWLHNQRIRLYGVDTEECRSRDLEGKRYGLEAKKFVEEFAPVGSEVILVTHEKGKYGRYLGDIKSGRKWVCKELVKAHRAVPYHGQSKAEIREAHLENRRILSGSGS